MFKHVHLASGLAVTAGVFLSQSQALFAADFLTQVKPILEANCVGCHKTDKAEGSFDLSTHAGLLAGGDYGDAIEPGDPDNSALYTLAVLPADDENLMPPTENGGPLPKEITDVLKEWITEGANWPEGETLEQRRRVDFVEDIQPILEFNCVSCHMLDNAEGGFRLDTREEALTSGDYAPNLIPFDAAESALHFLTVLPEDDEGLMPPKDKGGPLPKEQTDLLKEWIAQGAPWPEGVTLLARKAEIAESGDEMDYVRQIRERIIANLEVSNAEEMKEFAATIPGSDVSFTMLPIPAGEFLMGSPDDEAGRKDDEGPRAKVRISPFWMGKTEVTWNEFELFMYPNQEKLIRELTRVEDVDNTLSDALARPTAPYVEMSFGMGKDGYPAISMTQHAANKYCQWLSAKTGQYYRLPTEAEWEYAARAGTTTAWSFGDDPTQIGEYAWYGLNSDWKYQKVGTKKPNPWGLHDMHGNVTEWVLDQYQADQYAELAGGDGAVDPWNEAVTLYPRVARGGSWDDDDPAALRSAVRRASGPQWKQQDPQLPKSIWYHTDAQFLGFRVVRPLEVPSAEELYRIWNGGRPAGE